MQEVMEMQEYTVKLEMVVAYDDADEEAVERDLSRFVTVLVEKAAGLASGPAGAIHGTTIELLFTVEAIDAAEMYSKLHDIAVILRDTGNIEFSASSARRGDRELALA